MTDQATLFDLQVVIYIPNGDRYGPIQLANNIDCSFPLSEVGALTFDYNKTAPSYDMLVADWCEVAVEYTTNGGQTWVEPPGGRFIRIGTDGDDMDEIGDTKFSFAAIGFHMNKILLGDTTVLKLDFPQVPQTPEALLAPGIQEMILNDEGKRTFFDLEVTPGKVLHTVMYESTVIGVMHGIKHNFTPEADTDSAAWPIMMKVAYAPGMSLKSIMDDLSHLCEWRTNGRMVEVFRQGGAMNRDLTEEVVYRGGYEIVSAPTKTSDIERVSRIAVYGDDLSRVYWSPFTEFEDDDPVGTEPGWEHVISPWGFQDAIFTQSGTTDQNTLQRIAEAKLDAASDPLVEKTIVLDLKHTTKYPFRDFQPGDHIGMSIKKNSTDIEHARVQQITLSYSADAGVSCSLIMSTQFEANSIRTAKKVAHIYSGTGIPNTLDWSPENWTQIIDSWVVGP